MPCRLLTLTGRLPEYPEYLAGSWQHAMVDVIYKDTGYTIKTSTVEALNQAYNQGVQFGKLTGVNLYDYMAASAGLYEYSGPAVAQSFVKNITLLPKSEGTWLEKAGKGLTVFLWIAAIAAGGYLLSQVAKFK